MRICSIGKALEGPIPRILQKKGGFLWFLVRGFLGPVGLLLGNSVDRLPTLELPVTETPQQLSSSPTNCDETSESASPIPLFVSLFIAEQPRIYRCIVALLGNERDADDVMQETATVLWRKFDEFQPGSSFFAWASKAAYYSVLQYRKRKGRECPSLDQAVLEQIAALSARDESLPNVRQTALQQCLDKLTSADRSLIEDYYLKQKKGHEIANELGRPERSIYRSLGRIRRALIECVRRVTAVAEREGCQ